MSESGDFLFSKDELVPISTSRLPVEPPPPPAPRLRLAERKQIEFFEASLDDLVDREHVVRTIWNTVCKYDLTPWLVGIRAVEGTVGRDHTDPRILLSLWILATVQGVSSAREVDRLCREHLAYRWLCGGVSVNYHLLADFRSKGLEQLDQLLTHIVASLMKEGLVSLDRVSHDGVRVRANAGCNSFRRAPTLKECLEVVRKRLKELKEQAELPTDNQQSRSAQIRAAEEAEARIQASLEECKMLEQDRQEHTNKKNEKRERKAVRVSTTDKDARVMKFHGGGFHPGANIQICTANDSRIIVAVEATNCVSDANLLSPILLQIEQRYGKMPKEAIVDGGYSTIADIETVTAMNVVVYAPLKDEDKQLSEGKNPYARKKGDSDAAADWRQRMGYEQSKAIYKERGSTVEWANAQVKNRGLQQMPVRGKPKWQCIALLHAITNNFVQAIYLRKQAKLAK